MKSDFVVVGSFEAIVGVREEKIKSKFFWIFRNVRESENYKEFLRGLSAEKIEKNLMSRNGREVIIRSLDITKCLELVGLGSDTVRYFQDISGIGKKIPKIRKRYIREID